MDDNALREFFETDEEFEGTKALWPVCPECGARRPTCCPVCRTVGDIFPPADTEFWDGTPPELNAPIPPKSACSCGAKECSNDLSRTVSAEPRATDYDNQLYWGMPDLRKDPLPALHDMPTYSVTDRVTEALVSAHRAAEEIESVAPPHDRLALVTCYVCDEPFVPKFVGRCPLCGHSFPTAESDDGDVQGEEQADSELDDEIVARYRSVQGDESMNGRVVFALAAMALLTALAAAYCWWLFR